MLDTSKIIVKDVRHDRPLTKKINKKYLIEKIQFLIDSGFVLVKKDMFDAPKNPKDENGEWIHYFVKRRQVFVKSNMINIIYYIEDFQK